MTGPQGRLHDTRASTFDSADSGVVTSAADGIAFDIPLHT
jgi:hypothetical protein